MTEFSKLEFNGKLEDPIPGCEVICNNCQNQLDKISGIPCRIMESRQEIMDRLKSIATDECPFFKLELKKLIESSSKSLLNERSKLNLGRP